MAALNYSEQVSVLNADLQTVWTSLAATQGDMNVFWLLLGGALVFFMQAGFGMLEAGCVRSSSVVNIVFKNLMDSCVGALMFYMFGYALAYGDDTNSKSRNGFLGNAAFFLVTDANGGFQDGWSAESGFDPYEFALWFFQYAFCATAATIVSGAIAERTQLNAYFAYSAWICGFVYPVVVHWTWSSAGWASPWAPHTGEDAVKRLGKGLFDFAGSGIVHMVGGFSALAGAILVGPRRGKKRGATEGPLRFSETADPADFQGHNMVFQVLGMFILWAGWFGFNCGSTLELTPGTAPTASRTAVTTMLGAAGGGIGSLAIDLVLQKIAMRGVEPKVDPAWKKWAGPDAGDAPPEAILGMTLSYDVGAVVNGVLAGLVSITAGCALVEPWAALLIGVLGGGVYQGASGLMIRAKVDDPLDAFAVHGACGFWGLVAVGLWATEANVAEVYGDLNAEGDEYWGAFYGGDGKQLGIQLLVGLVIAVWSFVLAGGLFFGLKLAGKLRVPDDEEGYNGLDKHEHGTAAYAKQ